METMRSCLVEKNTTGVLIASVHQNSSILQNKVMENPGRGMRALTREMGVAISLMNLATNKDLRYQKYKKCKGQLLSEKGQETI